MDANVSTTKHYKIQLELTEQEFELFKYILQEPSYSGEDSKIQFLRTSLYAAMRPTDTVEA